MKKIFMALSLALLCAAPLFAQEEEEELDKTFRFVKADGTEVPDGSVLNLTEMEQSIFGEWEINSGLYVENTSSTAEIIQVTMNVNSLSEESAIKFCVLGNCSNYPSVGTYIKSGVERAGNKDDLQLEWLAALAEDEEGEQTPLYGNASITMMIEHLDAAGKLVLGTGPTITLNFTYADPAGIKDVDAKVAKTIVARYSANGQLLTAPQKGLNIVKYADGTSAKVLVK